MFQVLNAQQAGYDAAIIHNMYSDTLLNMNYSNGKISTTESPEPEMNCCWIPHRRSLTETIADEIEIPSVFTSFYASQVFRKFIIPEQG